MKEIVAIRKVSLDEVLVVRQRRAFERNWESTRKVNKPQGGGCNPLAFLLTLGKKKLS